MPHLDVLFENTEFNGPGKYVGMENDKGCSAEVGEWVMRDDGFWAYRIHGEAAYDDLHGPGVMRLSEEQWKELLSGD